MKELYGKENGDSILASSLENSANMDYCGGALMYPLYTVHVHLHYVRWNTLYHRNLPSSCGDGRPVYWLRTRMGRLLSPAPLDQRGASPRLASYLQTLAAHFRAWPPASDPQRRLFRFHHRKHETRLAPHVAAGHRVRVRD